VASTLGSCVQRHVFQQRQVHCSLHVAGTRAQASKRHDNDMDVGFCNSLQPADLASRDPHYGVCKVGGEARLAPPQHAHWDYACSRGYAQEPGIVCCKHGRHARAVPAVAFTWTRFLVSIARVVEICVAAFAVLGDGLVRDKVVAADHSAVRKGCKCIERDARVQDCHCALLSVGREVLPQAVCVYHVEVPLCRQSRLFLLLGAAPVHGFV
jgi:hypothetical protein